MSGARVTMLRSVDLGVTDMEAARRFYVDVWLLSPVDEREGVLFLRGTGSAHHIVTLRDSPRPGLLRIVLGAADASSVDALHEAIVSRGLDVTRMPVRSSRPGGGYGFGFKDPEGRNFAVLADVADHAEARAEPNRPTKLSHVNLNSGSHDASFRFFTDVLGFRLSDTTRQFRFLRCNADHHSLVLGFNQDATLNHIAFELPDLESVMFGIGRMRDHGYPVEWGPGRHGPGTNAFAYFVGPEELPLEYTAEMQQVDDSYKAGRPEDWTWPPGRVDRWGLVAGPSARVKRTQSLFRFHPAGHGLPL